MQLSKLRKLFGRGSGAPSRKMYYVHGSGLVPVPTERLNEITKVISELHNLEADRALQMAKARTRVGN